MPCLCGHPKSCHAIGRNYTVCDYSWMEKAYDAPGKIERRCPCIRYEEAVLRAAEVVA